MAGKFVHRAIRQDIDPSEAERAAKLLAEVYQVEGDILPRRPMGLLEKRAGVWRQIGAG
jgi:hypothetical protein